MKNKIEPGSRAAVLRLEGKTINEVILATGQAMKRKEVQRVEGVKYFRLQRVGGIYDIVYDNQNNYYAYDLFNLYGKFKTTLGARRFIKEILMTYLDAQKQAMWAGWEKEGANFCK